MLIHEHIRAIREADECQIMEYPFNDFFRLLELQAEKLFECTMAAIVISESSGEAAARNLAAEIAQKLSILYASNIDNSPVIGNSGEDAVGS